MRPLRFPIDPARTDPALAAAEAQFFRAVARVFWDDLDRRTRAALARLGFAVIGPAG
jgi:hypothetical protein